MRRGEVACDITRWLR